MLYLYSNLHFILKKYWNTEKKVFISAYVLTQIYYTYIFIYVNRYDKSTCTKSTSYKYLYSDLEAYFYFY